MAKNRGKNAYITLAIILVLLLLLAVGCYLLKQWADTDYNERVAQAQADADQINTQLDEDYRKAKAEEKANAQEKKEEAPQWPTPKSEGWDVLDVSYFPISNSRTLSVTRKDLIKGGMLLLNHWHSMPADFPETDLVSVHTSKNGIPVKNSSVKLFPAAVTALEEMLKAANDEGLDGYLIDEGYRTNETQQGYYDKEAAHYAEKLSGDALRDKVSQTVNYPGTSEYQSGLSFRVDRYKKDDKEFMDKKFKDMEQSDWLLEHSWEYGIIFRFPVQGYPNSTVTDKAWKTGEHKQLSIYRYVGRPNAAVMHIMDFCMEEYIEYLIRHPHIVVYQDGVLKYEITWTEDKNLSGDVTVTTAANARETIVSTDNCGGIIVAIAY
ncbi:MAG: M15 family metallopeptidase [Clostridia bacterium]|nr:M15 family metallopeptidase [Clostridia bacterium]